MKIKLELRHDLQQLRNDLRNKITSYACSFDAIKVKDTNIHFEDQFCREREVKISAIYAEGSNVGIYPANGNYMSHSENTIQDIHDLFCILSIIENHLNIK